MCLLLAGEVILKRLKHGYAVYKRCINYIFKTSIAFRTSLVPPRMLSKTVRAMNAMELELIAFSIVLIALVPTAVYPLYRPSINRDLYFPLDLERPNSMLCLIIPTYHAFRPFQQLGSCCVFSPKIIEIQQIMRHA